MNREVHVRFWEGVGVRSPRATHLPARLRHGRRCQGRDRRSPGLVQPRPAALESEGATQSPDLCPHTGRGVLRSAADLAAGGMSKRANGQHASGSTHLPCA